METPPGGGFRKDSASCDRPHGALWSSVHPASVHGLLRGPTACPRMACAGLDTPGFHWSLCALLLGDTPSGTCWSRTLPTSGLRGVQGQPRHLCPPHGDQGCGHLGLHPALRPGACRLPLQAALQTQDTWLLPPVPSPCALLARSRWRHWEGGGGGGTLKPREVTEAASAWPPRWSPDLRLSSFLGTVGDDQQATSGADDGPIFHSSKDHSGKQ